MCISKPKMPPPPAQFQQMQAPKDMTDLGKSKDRFRRRGFWASIMTGPGGVGAPVSVTGSGGGTTGG